MFDSIMKLFRAGDHIVCAENVYGGTFRLFEQILKHFGLQFTFVDTRDPQRVEDATVGADGRCSGGDTEQSPHAAHRPPAQSPTLPTGPAPC